MTSVVSRKELERTIYEGEKELFLTFDKSAQEDYTKILEREIRLIVSEADSTNLVKIEFNSNKIYEQKMLELLNQYITLVKTVAGEID